MSTASGLSCNFRSCLLVLVLLFVIAGYFWLSETNFVSGISSEQQVEDWVRQAGIYGPLLIIVLLASAIVISPLPSAPVALVSGLLYGHGWGTVYVITGATTGAVAAFMLSRFAGKLYVKRKLESLLPIQIAGSQNIMMLIVFVSRLMPFISFDVISYAAGLTSLNFWRFLVATLLGIVPMSFLLAHIGSEAATGEVEKILYALLFIGVLTLLSVAFQSINHWRKKNETSS